MTVMSNIYVEQGTHFSTAEIGAARNAFLQYDEERQIHLLAVMPTEEAVGILSHCTVAYVQYLIEQLEDHGFGKRARQYAQQLGFSCSEVKAAGGVRARLKQHAGRIVSFLKRA